MILLFANNAVSVTTDALTANDTVVQLAAGQGNKFPQPVDNESYFKGTLSDATGAITEIVNVIARDTDTLVVVRGQENTTPLPWPAGTAFKLLFTKETINAFIQAAQLGVPFVEVSLDSEGVIDLDGIVPNGAPLFRISLTSTIEGQEISDIVNAPSGIIVILTISETSEAISIPLEAPFFLSDISGEDGWPGFPLSSISLIHVPENTLYKWVEQSRTWRLS